MFVRDQKAFACGDNSDHQFGSFKADYYYSPVVISTGLGSVVDADVTDDGTFILTENGLYSSGWDSLGELSSGIGGIQTSFMKVRTL